MLILQKQFQDKGNLIPAIQKSKTGFLIEIREIKFFSFFHPTSALRQDIIIVSEESCAEHNNKLHFRLVPFADVSFLLETDIQ